MSPRKLLVGYGLNGFYVHLTQQVCGSYEVVYGQAKQPTKTGGIFPPSELIRALNKYHRLRDMTEAAAKCGRACA